MLGGPPQPPKLAPFNGFRVCPQTPGRLKTPALLAVWVFRERGVRKRDRPKEKALAARQRKINSFFSGESVDLADAFFSFRMLFSDFATGGSAEKRLPPPACFGVLGLHPRLAAARLLASA